MKKFLRILFDGFWPTASLWLASVLFFLAVDALFGHDYAFFGISIFLGLGGILLFLACSLLLAIAFLCALCRRRWKRAIAQILLVAAILPAASAALRLIECPPSGPRAWKFTSAGVPFPFAVGYRFSDPILGGWHKCVAFRSGRKTGLASGEDSNAPVAIYGLDSGLFAIVQRDPSGPTPFYFYRIDPAVETVEYLSAGVWYTLPPDTTDFISWGAGAPIVGTKKGRCRASQGTPDDGSFQDRRFLGTVHPDGTFDPDAGDPFPPEGAAP